jgi:hypothetical protein
MEREELGRVAEMLGKLSESTDNLIVGADGTVKPAQPMSDCAISYVNCTTKKTEVVSLKKGDTFAYGDWDGSRCVRKTYTC